MTTLRLVRGDTLALDLAVLKPDGTPQPISGSTIRFTAKARHSDLDAAAILAGSTVDGKVVITDAPGGLAEVTIPAAETAPVAPQSLYWDVQITAGTITRTLDSGLLIIEPDVTITTP